MELNDAIERVENSLKVGVIRIHDSHSPSNDACRDALRTVLRLAKTNLYDALEPNDWNETVDHWDAEAKEERDLASFYGQQSDGYKNHRARAQHAGRIANALRAAILSQVNDEDGNL